MRKFVIGGIAAVVLALGFTAGNASAYWTTRTVYSWDPVSGAYVPVVQRVWVPDPVVYVPSYYSGFYAYRPWYYRGFRFDERHERHERHEHEHHHHR